MFGRPVEKILKELRGTPPLTIKEKQDSEVKLQLTSRFSIANEELHYKEQDSHFGNRCCYRYCHRCLLLLQPIATTTTTRKKNTINKDEKKDTKDSQKETEGAKKSTAPSNPPIYPVSSNGEPDFSNKANFTAEEKDKYALALKDKGNQFFRNKKYDDAIKYYNWALELKEDPVFYSNLSACYVSVGDLKKLLK